MPGPQSARRRLWLSLCVFLAACAHIDFTSERGLLYYEPRPYLYVVTAPDCSQSATVISLPGTSRHLRFVPGYGSADLKVELSNGVITSAGQNTDAKLPDTITALVGLKTASAAEKKTDSALSSGKDKKPVECAPEGNLYPISDGQVQIDRNKAVPFPIKEKN